MIQETQKLTLDDPELNLRERNAETRDMIEKVSDLTTTTRGHAKSLNIFSRFLMMCTRVSFHFFQLRN